MREKSGTKHIALSERLLQITFIKRGAMKFIV